MSDRSTTETHTWAAKMTYFRFLYRAIAIVLAIAVIAGLVYLDHSRGKTPLAPTPAASDKPDETAKEVELSDGMLAAAAIELATAGPGVLRDSLILNGIIQPNQEALVQVAPRFPGVVREIRARIGDRVAKGDLLATVESNQSLTAYELRAPISGTIINRQGSLGEYASEQKPAFVIADLSTVWVDFSVYRRDLARVSVDDTILIDAEDGGSPIEAKVAYVSPVGNSDTQSALARAVVDNRRMRLRPGLFVAGKLLLAAKSVPIAIKSEALSNDREPDSRIRAFGVKFEVRNVEIGANDPQFVEVISGLRDGDVYAAKNSFVIKAELAKGLAEEE
jgi:membrane fusion protein, heavy metal efflux system